MPQHFIEKLTFKLHFLKFIRDLKNKKATIWWRFQILLTSNETIIYICSARLDESGNYDV